MSERQKEIHDKSFDIAGGNMREVLSRVEVIPSAYGKIKVGTKVLDDAVLSLGNHKNINRQYSNKAFIMKALYEKN